MVALTPKRLKILAYSMHILHSVMIVSFITSESAFHFAVRHGLGTVGRYVLQMIFLDPAVSIPFQIFFTALEIGTYFVFFGRTGVQWELLAVAHFITLSSHVVCGVFIDRVLRQRIKAMLEKGDAESLVSSFRRMLRGVCDGEVLLDSQMNVAQESDALKHLILTSVSLVGRSFERLLADEEHKPFKDFVESSMDTLAMPKKSAVTPCLRVSFRGSAGIRVAADIFHVPVPGLYGASEPYHLIAFKEDFESRVAPEADDDSVPAELLHRTPHPVEPHGDATSISGSTGRSSSVQAFPNLHEIFLLVDVNTELQEIQQVELNFQREENISFDQRHPSFPSSMPSLRKLVKPADWEKLRTSVARFAELSSRDAEIESKGLKQLTVQLPGYSGWLMVDKATLFRNKGTKVWLHLQGLHPQRVPRGLEALLRHRRTTS